MSENAKTAFELEPRRARGRPKADDLAELEARLIRVARHNFAAHGYGATSMNEVAKAARVSKGTLYARFPSKAALFRAIIDDEINNSSNGFPHESPVARSLESALRLYAERALAESVSGEILQLNRLIYSEAERFPELGQAAAERSRIGVQQVSQFIREYAIKDAIPCRDPEPPAELFTTLLRGFYSDAMRRGKPVSTSEIKSWLRRMLKIFLAGRAYW
jgi:AcrR family transcriptional regulator